MWSLLKKDYYLNRFILSTLILSVGAVIILLSMRSNEGSIFVGIMGTVFVPMLVNKFNSTDEMRKNYDFIINSFPVRRRDVVISKFLYYLIAYGVTAFILGFLTIYFNHLDKLDLQIFLAVESGLFFYYSFIIAIPNFIYYFFSYEVSLKYATAITLGITYIPFMLLGVIVKMFPETVDNVKLFLLKGPESVAVASLVLVLAGLLIYTILMILSVKGYSRRDLN